MNGDGWYAIPPEWIEYIKTPMTYVDMRLLFGDQGKGKSITGVACVIDNYYQYATHAVSPEGEILKVRALNLKEQLYLSSPAKDGGCGIPYNNLKHFRVFNDDLTKSKIVSIPSNYCILSPVKVFANRTLYGIRYVTFDLEKFIGYINTDLMTNGWVLLSESVLVSRKDTMSYLGRFMEWFGAECRKRHIRMIVDMQYRRMIQSVFHLYATTTVECDYDPDTSMVTIEVNKNSPVMASSFYISKPYRRFYKSDEHMDIPQGRINRALATVVG